MVLSTEEEKLKFLAECYKHIKRIYSSKLTKSEKGDFLSVRESTKKIAGQFPKSIVFDGDLNNVKNNKLSLLIDVYNKAAAEIASKKPINLPEFFAAIKDEYEDKRLTRQCYFNTTPDILMGLHRRHILRGAFLGSFFSPKSETFLRQYGFFDLQPEPNETKINNKV